MKLAITNTMPMKDKLMNLIQAENTNWSSKIVCILTTIFSLQSSQSLAEGAFGLGGADQLQAAMVSFCDDDMDEMECAFELFKTGGKPRRESLHGNVWVGQSIFMQGRPSTSEYTLRVQDSYLVSWYANPVKILKRNEYFHGYVGTYADKTGRSFEDFFDIPDFIEKAKFQFEKVKKLDQEVRGSAGSNSVELVQNEDITNYSVSRPFKTELREVIIPGGGTNKQDATVMIGVQWMIHYKYSGNHWCPYSLRLSHGYRVDLDNDKIGDVCQIHIFQKGMSLEN